MLAYPDPIGIGLCTTGVMIGHSPFGGPVTLRVAIGSESRETSVGQEVADCIYVVAT